MPPPQGTVSFPGLVGISGGSFAFGHGIQPSVALVNIVPSTTIPAEIGTMTLRFDGTVISFPNCKIDQASLRINQQRIVAVSILDRRWKWREGSIFGKFNIRDKEGFLEFNLRKTPQELATLLFQAMGENATDISRLPNTSNPQVTWIAANPAQELQKLCANLGCSIILGLDNIPRIVRIGVNEIPVPRGGIMTRDFGVDPADIPDSILVVGGQTIFQSRWDCSTAMGKEQDGTFREIDDLTYTPTNGWGSENEFSFWNVSDEDDRKLAQQSVFKIYRIQTAHDIALGDPNQVKIPDPTPDTWVAISGSERKETILRTEQIVKDATDELLDPQIRGIYYDGEKTDSNTADHTLYDGSFSIDTEHGFVIFNEPVFEYFTNATVPATLTLLTSYILKDTDTELFARWQFEQDLVTTKQGFGPHVIRREDLVRKIVLEYDIDNTVTGITDNLDEIKAESQKIIDNKKFEFGTKNTSSAKYAGFKSVSLDGAIRQISWKWGDNAEATTVISLNFEHDYATLPLAKQQGITITQTAIRDVGQLNQAIINGSSEDRSWLNS